MNKQIPIVLAHFIVLMGCSGHMPDLGVNNGRLAPCPESPNCASSQAADEKHFIQPIHFTGTRQEARARLLQVVESQKRTKILEVRENYFRAEATSAVFGFVDDVEFYFPAEAPGAKIIHVRSASRVGYSDLGVNRKRIKQIRDRFHKMR